MSEPCWCNRDRTTGGHYHNEQPTTQTLLYVQTGCMNPSGGGHDWLPWLKRGGSAYTRCTWCGREEQWDTEEALE
jgi:hypothetical protein